MTLKISNHLLFTVQNQSLSAMHGLLQPNIPTSLNVADILTITNTASVVQITSLTLNASAANQGHWPGENVLLVVRPRAPYKSVTIRDLYWHASDERRWRQQLHTCVL